MPCAVAGTPIDTTAAPMADSPGAATLKKHRRDFQVQAFWNDAPNARAI